MGAGSPLCAGRQCCWPVQRCAGAAVWPTCYLTYTCPSSVCLRQGKKPHRSLVLKDSKVVSWMNEGFAVREILIWLSHGLYFLPRVSFGVLQKYSMASYRCTCTYKQHLCIREQFFFTSRVNPAGSFSASPDSLWTVLQAPAVLGGYWWPCFSQNVLLIAVRGQFHWSRRERIWLDLLLLTSATEFSSARIVLMIGTCFKVVLHHDWHCCRCIRRIAKNRKFLIGFNSAVRRQCKFTVFNENSGGEREPSEISSCAL